MRIAPYYQKLLEQGLQAAKSLEPITFAGMFDSGVDYLFNLAIPLFEAELPKDVRPVFIDLSGVNDNDAVFKELHFALARVFGIEVPADSTGLTNMIIGVAKKTKVVLVVYLGQDGKTDENFFLFLNRLRNLLGWRFSYCLFATTRLFQTINDSLLEKVVKRNIVPVRPLPLSDASIVLGNYEERYDSKITQEKRQKLLDLSGGNPGLIKALYLQEISDSIKQWPDILEEQLYFRLKGITEDLSESTISLLGETKRSKLPVGVGYFLERYGYTKSKSGRPILFTSLLDMFWRVYKTKSPSAIRVIHIDPMLLHLTKSQRRVIAYLENHTGELVSKDTLAQVLWGDGWADRYSDWAIDQLISTLREKLVSMKHKRKIITKKGEGIIFMPKKL